MTTIQLPDDGIEQAARRFYHEFHRLSAEHDAALGFEYDYFPWENDQLAREFWRGAVKAVVEAGLLRVPETGIRVHYDDRYMAYLDAEGNVYPRVGTTQEIADGSALNPADDPERVPETREEPEGCPGGELHDDIAAAAFNLGQEKAREEPREVSRDDLWEVIARIRDGAPRHPEDADTHHIIDGLIDAGFMVVRRPSPAPGESSQEDFAWDAHYARGTLLASSQGDGGTTQAEEKPEHWRHRNGCIFCVHPEAAYPSCWTEEQVAADQRRLAAPGDSPGWTPTEGDRVFRLNGRCGVGEVLSFVGGMAKVRFSDDGHIDYIDVDNLRPVGDSGGHREGKA